MKTKKLVTVALMTSSLLLGSMTASRADESQSPSPTPSPVATSNSSVYAAQLAAYKIALTQYKVALVVNDISYRATMKKYWADWNTAVTAYESAWQATLANFQTLKAAYDAKVAPIAATRNTAIDTADAAFLAAIAANSSAASEELALTAHQSAVQAANTAFKAAIAALGAAPVRPTKPAELVKPPVPTKPVAPVKPVAPAKAIVPPKPGKGHSNSSSNSNN